MAHNALTTQIINQIKISGALTIAEFMQICLFDKENGYYTQADPFGAAGDFITSPEISQCFGEVVALYCLYYLQSTDGEIQIIELGPGRGLLMHDMLRVFTKFPEFFARISIHLVEKSAKLRQLQQEKLQEFGLEVKHYDDFSQIPKKQSFIISNELLDCLPMQQFEYAQDKWYERKVDYKGEFYFRLIETPASLLYPLLFLKGSVNKIGDIFEISPATITLMSEVAAFVKITKSKALIFDYGYKSYEFKPTIQAIRSHEYQSVFESLGKQDLTYLVNFPAIEQTLREGDLCNYTLNNQGEFLLSLGLESRINMCKKNQSQEIQDKLDRSLSRLTDKDQMGDLFKVLELG
ncbi:MAG: hypothetical protein HON23_00120 [Rickettsiales bacterium]|nr:hypothetical protein [Rickettsiales bacterium]